MKAEGSEKARQQMKLTSTERAILVDIAKNPTFSNDISDDENDTDIDSINKTLVKLDILNNINQSYSLNDQALNDTCQSFHDIWIIIPRLTMRNVIDEFIDYYTPLT